MDHFCPWVGNTIGFHNRKMFLLILLYTALEATFVVLTTLPEADHLTTWMLFVLFVDTLVALSTGVFGCMHMAMVLANQTTIELKYNPDLQPLYDVGWRSNIEQVFGPDAWAWLLPIYHTGPVGDGVSWPTQSGQILMENVLPDRIYQEKAQVGGYKAPDQVNLTISPRGTGRGGGKVDAKSPELV